MVLSHEEKVIFYVQNYLFKKTREHLIHVRFLFQIVRYSLERYLVLKGISDSYLENSLMWNKASPKDSRSVKLCVTVIEASIRSPFLSFYCPGFSSFSKFLTSKYWIVNYLKLKILTSFLGHPTSLWWAAYFLHKTNDELTFTKKMTDSQGMHNYWKSTYDILQNPFVALVGSPRRIFHLLVFFLNMLITKPTIHSEK